MLYFRVDPAEGRFADGRFGGWRLAPDGFRVSAFAVRRRIHLAMASKRELFKSADVCELTGLQAYVLRSWEAEFPRLGKAVASGVGRVYRRPDVELVMRIKQLVFDEGLTLAGARRRLDEEQQEPTVSAVAVAVDDMLSDVARSRLREVRQGLEQILQMLGPVQRAPELTLVAPGAPAGKLVTNKKRRAS